MAYLGLSSMRIFAFKDLQVYKESIKQVIATCKVAGFFIWLSRELVKMLAMKQMFYTNAEKCRWTGLCCIPTNIWLWSGHPIKSKVVSKVNILKQSWKMLFYPLNCVILDHILPRSDHKIHKCLLVHASQILLQAKVKSIPTSYVTTDRLQNLDNFRKATWAPGIGWIPDLKYDVSKNSWTRVFAAQHEGTQHKAKEYEYKWTSWSYWILSLFT